MTDRKKNLEAKIEAALFIHGEPMKIKQLASLLKTDEQKVKEVVRVMRESFDDESRGLDMIATSDKVQLVTAPELGLVVKKITQDELDAKLTPASLETLSIIAYLGPCSRALIEYIRGVNSSFILRNLMIRGLVERKTDPSRIKSFTYQVTFDFLKHMGASSQEELHEYERDKELAKVINGDSQDESTS